MEFLIKTPNENFKGTRLGVTFKKGEAIVEAKDSKELAGFIERGYKVAKYSGPVKGSTESEKTDGNETSQPTDDEPTSKPATKKK